VGALPDRLFVGGAVVTFDPAQPRAEALLVRDGRIAAVGPRVKLEQVARPGAQVTELGGGAVLPGFIDAHGHLAEYVPLWTRPSLSPPPVGRVRSVADLQEVLRCELRAAPPAKGGALLAHGYDDSQLEERRHPTREELDAISTAVPVGVLHVSGHLAVVNSVALRQLGISAATPDPPGGVIRRGPGGEPTGVLEEAATGPLAAWLRLPAGDEALRTLEAAQRWYASFGVTTAQDGAGRVETVALLKEAAARGGLLLDVVSYPLWTELEREDALRNAVPPAGPGRARYAGGFRVGGVKLVADGSPQGRTAWLTEPYVLPRRGVPGGERGVSVAGEAVLDRWLDEAWRSEVQVLVHANGDAALDAMLDAVAKAQRAHGKRDLRPVAVHAQLARYDQVDRMGALGVVPSFFSAHTFYWGDWHREVLGALRASRISPLAYAASHGLWFTNHADAPVLPPDMLRLAWTAVTRQTRSGQVLGPAERVSAEVALRAQTQWAAFQYFEEADKGTLSPGKRADLVLLSANPLEVPPEEWMNLTVVETLKDGHTVYLASEGKPPGPGGAPECRALPLPR
jgi:predicted amidohydrolase YtcJ